MNVEGFRRKALVVYHHICRDGAFAAAYLLRARPELDFEFVGVRAGAKPHQEDVVIKRAKKFVEGLTHRPIIFMLDVFTDRLMFALQSYGYLCIIDHHKSAFESLELHYHKVDAKKLYQKTENVEIDIDMTMSSALRVVTKYGLPDHYHPLANLVSLYDTGQHEVPGVMEMSAYFDDKKYDFSKIPELLQIIDKVDLDVVDFEGKELLIKRAIYVKRILTSLNHVFLTVEAENKKKWIIMMIRFDGDWEYCNDLHALLRKKLREMGEHQGEYYITGMAKFSPEGIKMSFRSVGNVTVHDLAKHFDKDGGGHGPAAGCTVPFEYPLNNLFNY